MTVDKMIADYQTVRAEKKRLQAEYATLIARLDDVLTRMEGRMLKVLLDSKVKHMATDLGTMYIEKVSKASCTDWQAYRKWMVENDALDGLEKRVTQSFIKEYEEDNQGALPPGITVYKENVARVRKT